MKTSNAIRSYYVMPCCLLLLNLCVEIVSYKAKAFGDPLLRVLAIMAMVLFGGSLVAFVATPAVELVISHLHRGSRRSGGSTGELCFLLALGAVVFWLYYRVYIISPGSILPTSWRNAPLR